MGLRLVVRNALNEVGPTEVALSFDREVIAIGRQPDCELYLEDRSVSREHAQIYRDQGAWLVRDVGSSRGTLHNERPLVSFQPAALSSGDVVTIGPYRIEFLGGSTSWEEDTPAGGLDSGALHNETAELRSGFLRWMDRNFGAEPPSLMILDGRRAGNVVDIQSIDEDLVLGRGLDCGVVFSDESISRHHARLRRSLDGVRITDLGSRNHMLVNGLRVDSARLKNGDEIRLGKIRLKFKDPIAEPEEPELSKVDRHGRTTESIAIDEVDRALLRSGVSPAGAVSAASDTPLVPLQPLEAPDPPPAPEEPPQDLRLRAAPAGPLAVETPPAPIPEEPAPPAQPGEAAPNGGQAFAPEDSGEVDVSPSREIDLRDSGEIGLDQSQEVDLDTSLQLDLSQEVHVRPRRTEENPLFLPLLIAFFTTLALALLVLALALAR
jgi:pSer/pThr/pTyr-binding forkhead associated (FHA) protein